MLDTGRDQRKRDSGSLLTAPEEPERKEVPLFRAACAGGIGRGWWMVGGVVEMIVAARAAAVAAATFERG